MPPVGRKTDNHCRDEQHYHWDARAGPRRGVPLGLHRPAHDAHWSPWSGTAEVLAGGYAPEGLPGRPSLGPGGDLRAGGGPG